MRKGAAREENNCVIKIIRLAHLAELEMLGLDGLLDLVVLLWPHLDSRGGGGHLFQAVQHLPDVELLHFRTAEHRIEITRKR